MKILLIDDKNYSDYGYGIHFYDSLPEYLRKYVTFSRTISNLSIISDDQFVTLSFNLEEYDYIFLHYSYTGSDLDTAQLTQFSNLLGKKVYFFSGSPSLIDHKNKVHREYLYRHLKEFLEVKHKVGEFDLSIFFDSEYNPYKRFYSKLGEILVDNGKDAFLLSELLPIALAGSGYGPDQVTNQIEALRTLEEENIMEFINEELINL